MFKKHLCLRKSILHEYQTYKIENIYAAVRYRD